MSVQQFFSMLFGTVIIIVIIICLTKYLIDRRSPLFAPRSSGRPGPATGAPDREPRALAGGGQPPAEAACCLYEPCSEQCARQQLEARKRYDEVAAGLREAAARLGLDQHPDGRPEAELAYPGQEDLSYPAAEDIDYPGAQAGVGLPVSCESGS